jgi:hypothetical protein
MGAAVGPDNTRRERNRIYRADEVPIMLCWGRKSREEQRVRVTFASAVLICLCAPGALGAANVAPDFSGLWLRTGDLWFDPVSETEVAKPVQRLEISGPDAENIWAGDFSNPILQPWTRETVMRHAQSEMRLQHVYTADDSCWPSGVPQAVNLIGPVQFLQTSDHVEILYERDHQIRRIWLTRRHSAQVRPSWYGESIGHYEGNTLVVDTVGLKTHQMSVVDPFGTPHTQQLHVVERYRPFSTPFGRSMEVTVTVEDPGAFTTGWTGTAEYAQDKATTAMDEVVCAENNRDFPEGSIFGIIPQVEKPDF